jgi:hypothetical protein
LVFEAFVSRDVQIDVDAPVKFEELWNVIETRR